MVCTVCSQCPARARVIRGTITVRAVTHRERGEMVITSQLVCGPHLRVTEAVSVSVSVSDVTSDQ